MIKSLFIVMALLICAESYAYDIAVENQDGVVIYYNYTNDGKELKVTSGASKYSGMVVIPDEVTYMNRTRTVTGIEREAFYKCSSLTSVIIGNSVTSIGNGAFGGCEDLTSVIIGNSVTSIGDYSFYECSSLTIITIPNNVTSIGEYAFYGCSNLPSVIIGNSVTSIGSSAFKKCSHLASIIIPNSVTSIERDAFSECSSLTSVIISNSVTSIEMGTFSGCKGLTSVTIPNSVTTIGYGAFANCDKLASIIIPNSVTIIEEYAFFYDASLTTITIPNSVKSIGMSAFNGCKGLTSVTSLIKNPFVIVGKYSDYSTFDLDIFNNVTLYVPKGTIDKYKTTGGWKDFLFIEEGEGPGGGDTPTPKKCAKPTISYNKGQLVFNSKTDGVSYQYSITDSDIKSGSSSKVDLTVTYNISVSATKSGYEDSETTYATLCWIDVDPKTEGTTNNVAQVRAQPILIQTDNGRINITGLNEGQHVTVYLLDGKQVASTTANNNVANIMTNLSKGTIAIIKMNNESIKIVMK